MARAYLLHFSGWVACIFTRYTDIFSHYCACPDHYVIAYFYRQDGGIGSYRHVIPYFRNLPQGLITPGRLSLLENIVNKHHPMADETIFSDSNKFANKSMGLHFRIT